MKVLPVGGDIGGSITALCLGRAGVEACVFESAEEIRRASCWEMRRYVPIVILIRLWNSAINSACSTF